MLCNFLLKTGHFEYCNGDNYGNQILPPPQRLLLLLDDDYGCKFV